MPVYNVELTPTLPPNRAAAVIAALVMTHATGAPAAVTLSNASATYHIGAGGETADRVVTASATETVDTFLDFGTFGSVQAVAEVTVSFGRPPQVDLQLATDSFPPPHCSTCGMATAAGGLVEMEYQVAVTPSRPIPAVIPFNSIPIFVTGNVQVNASPPAAAGAGAWGKARVNGPAGFGLEADTRTGPPSGTKTESISLVIDQAYNVFLRAEASAVTNPRGNDVWAATSQAIADPILEFDQEAFDLLMGEDTFSLEDHFALLHSPNLVPEPSPRTTTGVALLTLGVCARRQRAKRPPRAA